MLLRLFRRLGVARTATAITAGAVLASVGISSTIDYLLHGQVALQPIVFAIAVPLVVSPILTTLFLRLLWQLETLQTALQEIAITDELTHLFNRRHWMELAEVELARARRHATVFSVMLIDLDDFKRVNDTYGHLAGDRVLRGVSRLCQAQSRTIDALARFGGEEFIFLLPESDANAAWRFAERIRRALEQAHFPYLQHDLRVTASIGVATLNDTTPNLDAMIGRADQALYAAKKAGKNRAVSANDLAAPAT